MKIVKETINFERGQDPIKSMDIGQTLLDKKFIEEINWDFGTLDDNDEIIELIKDYRGYPILILRNKNWIAGSRIMSKYMVSSIAGIEYVTGDVLEPLIEDIKQAIDDNGVWK